MSYYCMDCHHTCRSPRHYHGTYCAASYASLSSQQSERTVIRIGPACPADVMARNCFRGDNVQPKTCPWRSHDLTALDCEQSAHYDHYVEYTTNKVKCAASEYDDDDCDYDDDDDCDDCDD